MQNRYNTIETNLNTDLNAESDITDVFNTIENRFRDDYLTYYEHELPALSFESVESRAADDDDHYRIITVIFEINCRAAQLETARQNVKQYISLVEDFLMSDSWIYATLTKVGRSGYISTGDKTTGFRANGAVECEIFVLLPSTTVK